MSLTISLTPAQVEERLARLGIPCRFTGEELTALSTTPVAEGGAGMFAFPTPLANADLSLLNIRARVGTDPKVQPCIFDHPWYEGETFMRTPCPPGWHVLMMDVLPGSVSQPIHYSRSLNHQGLALPTAVEVVLMLFLHYADAAEQLLFRKHTWCADIASLDRCVTVGAFGRNGVFLSAHPANFASRGLGICPKRTGKPGPGSAGSAKE